MILKKQNGTKTKSDIAITTGFDLVSKLFSVIVSLLIIRVLTVEDYADITLFNSIATFLSGIIGSGLVLSFVRYYAENLSRGRKSNYLFVFLLQTVVLAFVLVAIAFVIYSLAAQADTVLLMAALLYGFTLSIVSASQAFYQAKNMFAKAGIIGNVRVITLLVTTVFIFFIFGKSCKTLHIMSVYVGSGLFAVAYCMYCIFFRERTAFSKNNTEAKKMLQESLWLILYCLIINLFNQLDIFMMKYWNMVNEVAQYGVAFRYYSIALSLLPAIQTVLRVKTADMKIVDSDDAKTKMAKSWVKSVAIFAICIVAVGQALSAPVLHLLNGAAYDGAIPIFRVLLVSVGISYLTAPNVGLMMSGNRQKMMCLIAFAALVVNLVGNYLFIPTYGGTAAAFTTVISQSILNVSCTLIIIKKKQK